MTVAQASHTQEIIARHDRSMIINLARYPIAFVRGQGSLLYDAEGREYLDLFAGFGGPILGHCHPDLIQAVTDQAHKLWHVGNLFHTEPQTRLAEAISKHGFGGRSFFCHCGSDANEAAIKLARLYGKEHLSRAAKTKAAPGRKGYRYKIITAQHSFHGRLFGSMMATAQAKVRQGFEPLLEGFSHVPFNDLKAMEQAIDDETIALMVEPIQGEGGVNVPDDGYLSGLRQLCDKHDLVLIYDEVWTGCGRTGKYFGYQHWDRDGSCAPDLMTLAKGAGGGLAVGVLCASPKLAEYFDHRHHGRAVHVTTLGGNCLGMAVAAKVFEVIERDRLLEHATWLGEHAVTRLSRFAQKHAAVKTARGRGLFIGIELNPKAPGAWFRNATDVVNRCLDRGLLVNGTQDVVVRLAPALTLSKEQLDRGLDVIESVIASA